MGSTFDIHEHRHRMKQLRDTGSTKLFENRDAIDCPVCGTAFDRLFVTRKRGTTFPENDGSRFCILDEDDGIYLFRH